jgi:hypothetical protein
MLISVRSASSGDESGIKFLRKDQEGDGKREMDMEFLGSTMW